MNKTIEKIESYISNINAITVYYSFEADDAHKEQLQQIASKTIAVFKETIDRLKTVRQQISDDEEFAKFLNRVSEKVESVYTVTLEKLKKEQEASLQKQLQENENIKPAADMAKTLKEKVINKENAEAIKEKVVSFVDSKEVKEVFDKISLGALNVADKCLDILIKFLDKDQNNGK